MTTLTKNRILQAGDEYLDPKGAWKPIPKNDLGLQIMFTDYKEVRRPSEAAKGNGNVTMTPVTDADRTRRERDKHETEMAERPPSLATTMAKPKTLPTVVSRKAHGGISPATTKAIQAILAEIPPPASPPSGVKPKGMVSTSLDTAFAEKPECEWIGRNGTFRQRGLRMESNIDRGVIKFRPIGARGVGKNAKIEFPASIIPQVTDWLLRQQLTEKEKAKYAWRSTTALRKRTA